MQTLEESDKRPVAITILCIVGFVTVTFAMIGGYLRNQNHSSPWLYIQLLGAAADLVSFWYIWQMRRWAVLLYALAVIANLAAWTAGGGTPKWPHIVVPIVICTIVLLHHRWMR